MENEKKNERTNIYEYLMDFMEEHLEKRKADTFVCPCCASGTHKNKTAALHVWPRPGIDAEGNKIYPKGFSCFAGGCELDKDRMKNRTIVEMAAYIYMNNVNGARKELDEWAEKNGVSKDTIDAGFANWVDNKRNFMDKEYGLYNILRRHLSDKYMTKLRDKEYVSKAKTVVGGIVKKERRVENLEIQRQFDFTQYCKTMQMCLQDTKYFLMRGISEKTAKKMGLGYDPAWLHPYLVEATCREKKCEEKQARAVLKKQKKETPRIIIPYRTDDGRIHAYEARSTRLAEFEAKSAEPKEKVGKEMPIYNYSDVMKNKPDTLFVVEGPFDAMSLIEIGVENVVAIGTTNNRKLVDKLALEEKVPLVIIALDDDRVGRNATESMVKLLEEDKIPYYLPRFYEEGNTKNFYGGYDDANEFLVADKEKFKKNVTAALKLANDKLNKCEIAVDDNTKVKKNTKGRK